MKIIRTALAIAIALTFLILGCGWIPYVDLNSGWLIKIVWIFQCIFWGDYAGGKAREFVKWFNSKLK